PALFFTELHGPYSIPSHCLHLRPVNQSAPTIEATALAEFHREVERIRASGVLGRSVQLQRLFDFLVGCGASGRVPKQVEVAIDCFDRRPDADSAQDATVRVTAHKLRRRLEDFYRDAGEPQRLSLPRGEYRLTLDGPAPVDAREDARTSASPVRGGWTRLLPVTGRERALAFVAGVLLLALLAALPGWRGDRQPPASLAAVRASPLWAPILADGLPVQLVLGDYYILGERDEHGEISRLVREFDINSRLQLQQRMQSDPA